MFVTIYLTSAFGQRRFAYIRDTALHRGLTMIARIHSWLRGTIYFVCQCSGQCFQSHECTLAILVSPLCNDGSESEATLRC